MDTDPEYYGATMISSPSFRGKSFNKKLDPSQLDIPDEDHSFTAKAIRTITSLVSGLLRPRQVIVLLRLLKALTFCTLCLTVISDLMFVFYVEISISDDVNIKLGGFRDRLIRIYGVGLAIFAVLVELDNVISDHFAGLKPFLVRSIMLLFVATVSGVSPMIGYERKQAKQQNNNYNAYGDDDGNDGYNSYNQNQQTNYIRDEVPGSTVAFQAITSFILFGCACAYFLFGIMCLDRFTARAFLADDDQVAAAVSATAIRDPARKDSYDSYEDGARHNSFSNNGTYSPNRAYSEERDRGQYEM